MLLYHNFDQQFPYSILSHFFDRGFPDWRVQDCASSFRGSVIYRLAAVAPIMPYFSLHIFTVKKSKAYNLTIGSACSLSIPWHPISYSISFDPVCDIQNNYGQYTMHMPIYSFWCSSTHACIRKSWTSDMAMSSQSSQTSIDWQGQSSQEISTSAGEMLDIAQVP